MLEYPGFNSLLALGATVLPLTVLAHIFRPIFTRLWGLWSCRLPLSAKLLKTRFGRSPVFSVRLTTACLLTVASKRAEIMCFVQFAGESRKDN